MSEPMKWYFHAETTGVHFLFAPLYLDSSWKLLVAYILIIAICWTERLLTYKLDTVKYVPYGNRTKMVIIRTAYYALATVLRLWYMLIAMYFNTGLFIVLVAALTSGQLIIEYKKSLSSYGSELEQQGGEGSIPLHSRSPHTQNKSYHDGADEEEQELFAVDPAEYDIKHTDHTGQM
ncbi:hypothetical protein VKS41_008928 [Umbelopsis sp. WA50703]